MKKMIGAISRLILVRHAETDGNQKDVFHGWTDVDLSEKGHAQAKKVAERLKKEDIDVLYSSSLTRALQTAGYISESINLPIIKSDGLKEINGGDWENIEYSKLPELFPDEHHTWRNALHEHQMPNGESIKAFQARLIQEIKSIIDKNRGKTICAVTHGNAIKALMCCFYDFPIEKICDVDWTENTSISMVEIDDDNNYRVLANGDASHLDESLYSLLAQEWYIKMLENKKGKL